jgi:hypothetical protein
MALILPQRWTRQPHYRAQLDPKWVAMGLNLALLPVGNQLIDCSKNNRVGSGGVRTNGSGLLGRMVSRTSGNYAFAGLMQNTANFSLIAVVRATNIANENVISVSKSASTDDAIQFCIISSQISLIHANTAIIATSTSSGLANNRTHIIGLTHDSSGGGSTTFYCDGRQLNTVAGTALWTVDGSGTMFVKPNAANPLVGGLGLHLDFTRTLPAERMRALTSNPWQVFLPQRPFYYVASGATDYPLDCASGSYSVTGSNTGFDTAITAATDSYDLTGFAANFDIGINGASGSYAVTGADTSFLTTYVFNAETGGYSLTGIATGFDTAINSASGSYALTGADASVIGDLLINSVAGSYTLTGVATGFDISVNANTGTYGVTGVDASIVGDLFINAATGSYALTGFDVSLLTNYSLDANSGSYTINGFEVNFDALGNYELVAEVGSYSVTGISANFDTATDAQAGAYTITGFVVSLLADYAINAETGAIVYTGANTGFDISLNADIGNYSFTGFDTSLLADYSLDADVGSYVVTGLDATFLFSGAAPILATRSGNKNIQYNSRVNLSTSSRKANLSTSKRR